MIPDCVMSGDRKIVAPIFLALCTNFPFDYRGGHATIQSMEVADMTNLKCSQEIAELLRISRQSVHRHTVLGTIPSVRIGRNFRYSAEEVLAALRPRKRRRQEN